METLTTPSPTPSETRIPAMPPPPGVTSNFDNPETLTSKNNIAMSLALPIVILFFGLRCYVRIFLKKVWEFEDWLALVSWIGTVSFSATGALTMAHYGGHHAWDITKPQAQQATYWFMIASVHYGFTICFVKLTILWLYRRVFSTTRYSLFDLCILVLIVFLIGFYMATNLAKIWQCLPREKIWIPSLPGECIDVSTLLNVSGIVNTVTDCAILLLPVKAISKLNLMKKKKVVLVLVFTVGLCGPAFSLAGFMVRWHGTSNPDKTWVHPEIIMWGLAELTTGVLCFSVPELGILFRKKAKSGPPESILKGRYLRKNSSNTGSKQSAGLSTIISAPGKRSRPTQDLNSTTIDAEADYYELAEEQGSNVGFAQPRDASGLPKPMVNHNQGGVVITRDFKVEASQV